jgi:hypothetical protein
LTKDEFSSLPPSIALGMLYDIAKAKLEPLKLPKVPFPPKYDGRLARKNRQFCYMSEMELESLKYWHQIYLDKPKDSEWADKDKKTATALGYWVEWRTCFPTVAWSGERDREKVTAQPPSRDPELHAWDAGAYTPPAARSERSFDDAPKPGAPDDDDIPF